MSEMISTLLLTSEDSDFSQLGGLSQLPRVGPLPAGEVFSVLNLPHWFPYKIFSRLFAPNDHRGKRRYQWQEIDGEYRQRLVPAILERPFLPESDLRLSHPQRRARL